MGGDGDGVEITSLEISVVGVLVWPVAGGRDATDTFHRRAKGKMRHGIYTSIYMWLITSGVEPWTGSTPECSIKY